MKRQRSFSLQAGVSAMAVAAVLAVACTGDGGKPAPAAPLAPPVASAPVQTGTQPGLASFDGVVQAVRQTAVAAQVAGAVVALDVKAGDAVRAGQVLMRLDARAAQQTAAAGAAQVRAARAALDAAARDFERQKQLLEKNYISQAAFDRAEAQFKSAQAEASAQLSSAGASLTQADFYVIRAPYAGVVSEVGVVLGDMAMPGRALVTLYDPAALRVSVAVPQSVAGRLGADALPSLEMPGALAQRVAPVRMQLLPAVDPATHTQELRLDLPAAIKGAAPGMFARVWLPAEAQEGARVFVPVKSVVRRAELAAVYVVGAQGVPQLRQVRLGRAEGDRVEVLSGLSPGERVALEPQAAAAMQ